MLIFNKINKILKIGLLTSLVILYFLLTNTAAESGKTTLVQAVMCKSVENHQPIESAVVFSLSQGEVVCFSRFDPVHEKGAIFHKWYKQDKLIFVIKLKLSPPMWSTFSRMQIRNEDKGPWRVEIKSEDDILFQNLRFSIAD
ncbi:MAG: DUF2914 domain-containing protein [Desulfobacteraceae bacterium]|nr:DUF2914 domain-containing protein [Desulfobacteraceae bacterium]